MKSAAARSDAGNDAFPASGDGDCFGKLIGRRVRGKLDAFVEIGKGERNVD